MPKPACDNGQQLVPQRPACLKPRPRCAVPSDTATRLKVSDGEVETGSRCVRGTCHTPGRKANHGALAQPTSSQVRPPAEARDDLGPFVGYPRGPTASLGGGCQIHLPFLVHPTANCNKTTKRLVLPCTPPPPWCC